MANKKRLIYADDLDSAVTVDYFEHFTQCHDTDQIALIDMVRECIGNAPTVDAVEVVHGWWENIRFITTGDGRAKIGDCSSCKSIERVRNYCPNCGTKMDGVDNGV